MRSTIAWRFVDASHDYANLMEATFATFDASPRGSVLFLNPPVWNALDHECGWVTRFEGSVHGTFDGGATWFPSLPVKGTPTGFTRLGDEWLFVASDAGIYRLALPR